MNREQKREYDRQYAIKNKEKKKAYRLKNRERFKAWNKMYYQKNKQWIKEKHCQNSELGRKTFRGATGALSHHDPSLPLTLVCRDGTAKIQSWSRRNRNAIQYRT